MTSPKEQNKTPYYTSEEVQLFSRVFRIINKTEKVSYSCLSLNGSFRKKVDRNHTTTEAVIRIPGHKTVIIANPMTEELCLKCFNTYLETNDWNKAYAVIEPYIVPFVI